MVHQLFALVNALRLKSVLDLVPEAWTPPEPMPDIKVSGSTLSPQQQSAVETLLASAFAEDRLKKPFRHESKAREGQSPAGGAGPARPIWHPVPYPSRSSVLQSRWAYAWSTLRWTMSSPGWRIFVTTCRSSASTRFTRQIGNDFTLAHELAHVLLHRRELEGAVHVDRGSLRRDALAAEGVDPIEIEANAFAAELLMPTHLLISALERHPLDLEDDDAVAALAKRFRVSDAAMRYRLNSLGESG